MKMPARNLRVTLGACAAAAMLLVGTAQAANEPSALISYRQATMKAVGGHMGALAAFAKGEVDFVDDVAGHAHAINELSKGLARLFPEGSGKEAGETRALPKIWEDWAGFEAAIKTMADESAKLAEVAKVGDSAAIAAQVGVLGKEGCGGCHKPYREAKD